MRETPSFFKHPAFQISTLGFLALCLLEILTILALNTGHFIYTLDDPYIHLRLAENIAQGHYGINLYEYSAPSSSVLWPFLLAPFSVSRFSDYIPLILNVFFSLGTLSLFTCLAKRIISDNLISSMVVIVFMLGTNLVGLTFTGMEHSFQVFLATAIATGLITEIERGVPPWWLILAAILGPLVRYEFLLLSVITGLYLTYRRHFLFAIWSTAIPIVCLLGFSWFLVLIGLEPLPNSVIVKTHMFMPKEPIPAMFLTQAVLNLLTRQGVVLASSLLLLGLIVLNPQKPNSQRLLALCATITALGHLCTSPMNFLSGFLHFDRYDMYIFAFIFSTILYLFRSQIAQVIQTHNRVWVTCVSLALFMIISFPNLRNVLYTPFASNNIYEQQYQMQRFAQNHLHQAVAVNDLGVVSYRNPYYVLDLWGLGSSETMHARFQDQSSIWMDRLAKKHDVQAAMIYDSWFPDRPSNWIRVATLFLGKPKISPSNASVSFYALDQKYLKSVNFALNSFQEDLPPNVRLERYIRVVDQKDDRQKFTNRPNKSGHI